MMMFWFWPVLFLVPVMLFWLGFGLIAAVVSLWARLIMMVLTSPLLMGLALACLAMVLVGPLLHGVGHLLHAATWIVAGVMLPVAFGIWMARRYPKLDHRSERAQW